MNLGCDILLEKIWDTMGLVRVYTRKKAQPPDFTDPLILTRGRDGITVESAVMQIHRSMIKDLNYAYVQVIIIVYLINH
jgi:uncharacterized protein